MITSENNTTLTDREVERRVLSTVISNSFDHERTIHLLSEDCFTNHIEQAIFRAAKRTSELHESFNIATFNQEVAKEECLTTMTPYELMAESYPLTECNEAILYLKELSFRRKVSAYATHLASVCYNLSMPIDTALESFNASIDANLSDPANVSTLEEQREAILDRMIRNADRLEAEPSTPTGFSELDTRGGLQPSDLVIIAAETSIGKTSFATRLAVSAIKSKQAVAIYSMEMTAEQISARIMAMESGINARSIMTEPMPMEDIMAAYDSIKVDESKLLFYDDSSTSSLDSIISSIRRLKKRNNIVGAFVDYLQILNTNQRSVNKEQAMGEAARRLKNLAKELEIWIVAISQLSRDRSNPLPTLSRLRDSGQIEEAADTVILIHRPRDGASYPQEFSHISTKNTALIKVAKGRNIGVFDFIARFNPHTTNFSQFYEIQELDRISTYSDNETRSDLRPF